MKLRIALLQMPVKRAEVQANLMYVLRHLRQLKVGSLDVLALPEMWTTDFVAGRAALHARQSLEALHEVQREAHRLRLAVAGSILEADRRRPGVFYNSFFWLDGSKVRFVYRKVHLFRPLLEHRFFRAGKGLGEKKFRGERFGLTVCYDLRFPEIYRVLAARGATLIWVPAAWPAGRVEHWLTLLRARAIENQVFVIGVNRVGRSARGFAFGGRSVVVSPWGEILWEGTRGRAQLARLTIDLADVARVRRKITVWQDRRTDLYKRWSKGR